MSSYGNPVLLKPHGRPNRLEVWPEAASQTYKKYQLVYLDSSGRVTLCGDAATSILGVVQEDGSNVSTYPNVHVDVIEPGDMLEMYYHNGTVVAGIAYGILASPTGHTDKSVINYSNTTQIAFRIRKVLDSTNMIALVSPYLPCGYFQGF